MKIKISFFSLFKQFFLYPRKTTKKILIKDPSLYLVPLCAIYLLSGPLVVYARYHLKSVSLSFVLLTGFVDLLISFASLIIAPLFMLWMGEKLGGRSSYQKVRASFMWSHATWVLIFVVAGLYLDNRDSISKIFLQTDKPPHAILLLVFLLMVIFLSISILVFMFWPIVLFCRSFSETQKISVLKSGMVLASWWVINWLFWWPIVHFLNFNPNSP